jgi:pimeloyl-ACP methyl ester carboxylesterase
VGNLVLVHGAGNALWGPASIHAKWYPAVLDGLSWHGQAIAPDDVRVAFYGDLFRPDPERGYQPPVDGAAAIAQFSKVIQGIDPHVDLAEMVKVLTEQHLDLMLAQATAYFVDPELHAIAQERIAHLVDDDTVAVVAHSLGTVVAYETLCRHPEWPAVDFITMGSPLGGAVIKAALESKPGDGPAPWPGSVRRWTNIRGSADPACLDRLAHHFDGPVVDRVVDNGHRVHDPEPYLNNPTTGSALADALTTGGPA